MRESIRNPASNVPVRTVDGIPRGQCDAPCALALAAASRYGRRDRPPTSPRRARLPPGVSDLLPSGGSAIDARRPEYHLLDCVRVWKTSGLIDRFSRLWGPAGVAESVRWRPAGSARDAVLSSGQLKNARTDPIRFRLNDATSQPRTANATVPRSRSSELAVGRTRLGDEG